MKVTVLKSHVDANQVLRRRGDTIDLAERDAENKIRRGIVRATSGRSSPERAAAKQAPEVKKGGKDKKADDGSPGKTEGAA